MEQLNGKIIEKIFIDNEDQSYLQFKTDDGNVCFRADSDCCSESYFSDVNRLKNFIGEKINKVEEVELMAEEYQENESRQEVDKIYGYKIHTDKGIGLIIMRNSSNGFYGGECSFVSIIPEEIDMVEITTDYCSRDKKII